MKDLLVCIAHHGNPGRSKYLAEVLLNFACDYELSKDIIVDTNIPTLSGNVRNLTIVAHPSLEHPFHLTYMHRRHMRDRIEDYRFYMYIEDDMLIPWENFDHWLSRFTVLWPDYYPSFVRVEKHDGEEWAVDQTERQQCLSVRGNHVALAQPYCACWCLSQDALKASMGPNFVRFSDSREAAASYPIADLNKTALVQIDDDGKVDRRCFAFHLSNSYAPCPTSPFGKIKVADIFL